MSGGHMSYYGRQQHYEQRERWTDIDEWSTTLSEMARY